MTFSNATDTGYCTKDGPSGWRRAQKTTVTTLGSSIDEGVRNDPEILCVIPLPGQPEKRSGSKLDRGGSKSPSAPFIRLFLGS